MTKSKLIKRRAALNQELSNMSREGWKGAKQYDYLPLEKELREIENALAKKL